MRFSSDQIQKIGKEISNKVDGKLYLMNFLEVDTVQMHQFIKSSLLV